MSESKYNLPILVRLKKLLGFRMVAIQSFAGEVFYRRARLTPFGLLVVDVYGWVYEGGLAVLKEDGSVFRKDEKSAYYTKWKEV